MFRPTICLVLIRGFCEKNGEGRHRKKPCYRLRPGWVSGITVYKIPWDTTGRPAWGFGVGDLRKTGREFWIALQMVGATIGLGKGRRVFLP